MSVESVLRAAGLSPWVDARASSRPADTPKKLSVVGVGGDDTQEAIAAAVSTVPVPVVLVMISGGVLVLAQGGYGPIAVQGDPAAMPAEQSAALEIVTAALSAAYGLEVADAPKKRARKKIVEDATIEDDAVIVEEEQADA